MVPAGETTEQTVRELGAPPRQGRRHHRRRQHLLQGRRPRARRRWRAQGHLLHRRRHQRRRVGARARLLPDGRRRRRGRSQRLEPIFKTLAPGKGDIAADARASTRRRTCRPAEEGYLHCGPVGAGHFVKMVHNGIEYGLMQAYAEGFDILRGAPRKDSVPDGHRYDLNLADDRRGLAARQRRRVVAARSDGERRSPRVPTLDRYTGARAGLRRRPLDDPGGDRGGGAGAGAGRRRCSLASARARSTPSARRCSRRCASKFGGHVEHQVPSAARQSGRRPSHERPRRRRTTQMKDGHPVEERGRRAAAGPGGAALRDGRSSARRATSRKRKLIPALLQPAPRRPARGRHSPSSAIGAAGVDGRGVPRQAARRRPASSRAAGSIGRRSAAGSTPACRYVVGDLDDPATYRRASRDARAGRRAARHRGQRALLPGGAADASSARSSSGLGAAGPRPGTSGTNEPAWRRIDRREAVRPRPRNRPARSTASWPRSSSEPQIYRIDHYLGKETVQNIMVVPLRQRHLRADLEPPLHRPRADHRRRDGRRRGPRRLLRDGRRAARHGAEPHVPAARADRDGAAGLVRRRRGARREGQGAARDPAVQPRGRARRDVVRGQYGAGAVDGKRVPGYREEPSVAPDSRTETFVALKLFDRQLALGRRAVLPAHRQAPAEARHRDRHPVQARRRCMLFRDTAGRAARPEPAGRSTSSRTKGISLRFAGQGARARRCASARCAMDFKYADYFGADAADRLRDAALRLHDSATRRSSIAPTWSRRGGDVVTPILDDVGDRTPDGVEAYPAGSWGPPRRTSCSRATGGSGGRRERWAAEPFERRVVRRRGRRRADRRRCRRTLRRSRRRGDRRARRLLRSRSPAAARRGAVYERLAEPDAPAIDWTRVHVFFGDERVVPPDHADSNYAMARDALLRSRAPMSASRIHPYRGRARRCGRRCRCLRGGAVSDAFSLAPGAWPRLRSRAARRRARRPHRVAVPAHAVARTSSIALAAAACAVSAPTSRVTLTSPVLNAARGVLFLVSGADKADAVARAFDDGVAVTDCPVRGVRPAAGSLTWHLDADAASKLSNALDHVTST